MGKQILVVDDDAHIREVVRFALEQANYAVSEARDGADALAQLGSATFDALVLDISMPGLDGLDVCRAVRQTSTVPIIFLSSRDEELDKILGLELGADDYMAKPFSPRELVARIKAVLRRNHGEEPASEPSEVIQHQELTLDIARHRCTFADQPLVLTVTEFAMLEVLARAPGRVYTRDQLVDKAIGTSHIIADRTVDSHIRRIRKKLSSAGADLIETVHGLGYRMRE